MQAHWRVRQHVLRRINPHLKERFGLETPELFLLHYIRNSELSPGEISEAMHLPPHAISRRLELLESSGYLRRDLDPGDGRRRILSLTETGDALLNEGLDALDQAASELLARLAPEEQRELIGLLEKLTQEGLL